eukprot:TRINITY_DN42671_c0_g1_i1.p1 TRINITY_DN42671_c0_g1~~TRINITY_DN42671_c0_g1_i1.p1  ORF type:complete len:368 (+),score=69.84 TRINITY_DN42671_c0_g1_i1:49-1104(+)
MEVSSELAPPCASEVIASLLWVGSADASSSEAVELFGFQRIVNVSQSLPFPNISNFPKLRVPLSPNVASHEFVQLWPSVLEFLSDAQSQGHKVLVHCSAGRSRAAAVAVAYVMHVQGLSFPAALKEVRRNCPTARPNAALASALQDLKSQGAPAASTSGAAGTFAPMAIEDGNATSHVDEASFEAAVAQLGELLPVPIDVRRDVLMRYSGNVERAASELLAWLDGEDLQPTSKRPALGASSSSSSSTAAANGWASLAIAASSVSKQQEPDAEVTARVRATSEDGTAALEPRQHEAARSSGYQLAQCYVDGQEQLPECIICGHSSKRGGATPVAHQDLGWVHDVCLKQAGWT